MNSITDNHNLQHDLSQKNMERGSFNLNNKNTLYSCFKGKIAYIVLAIEVVFFLTLFIFLGYDAKQTTNQISVPMFVTSISGFVAALFLILTVYNYVFLKIFKAKTCFINAVSFAVVLQIWKLIVFFLTFGLAISLDVVFFAAPFLQKYSFLSIALLTVESLITSFLFYYCFQSEIPNKKILIAAAQIYGIINMIVILLII